MPQIFSNGKNESSYYKDSSSSYMSDDLEENVTDQEDERQVRLISIAKKELDLYISNLDSQN